MTQICQVTDFIGRKSQYRGQRIFDPIFSFSFVMPISKVKAKSTRFSENQSTICSTEELKLHVELILSRGHNILACGYDIITRSHDNTNPWTRHTNQCQRHTNPTRSFS